MYTAKILDQKPENGQATVIVQFTNGTITITDALRVSSLDALKQIIAGKLNDLNNLESKPITLGNIDLTPLPTPTPTPSPADISRQTFITDLTTFKQMKQAIALGLKTPTDKDFVDLQAKLISEFLPTYLNLL